MDEWNMKAKGFFKYPVCKVTRMTDVELVNKRMFTQLNSKFIYHYYCHVIHKRYANKFDNISSLLY